MDYVQAGNKSSISPRKRPSKEFPEDGSKSNYYDVDIVSKRSKVNKSAACVRRRLSYMRPVSTFTASEVVYSVDFRNLKFLFG